MPRSLFHILALTSVLLLPDPAGAQFSPAPAQPRRQFVTLSIDRGRTFPLHFQEQPLEQLTGKELSGAPEPIDYRSQDGLTTVDVLEFTRGTSGVGITVYPIGAGNGASLAVRGSYEELPIIRFVIQDPAGIERYQLTDGRAYDLGIGVIVNDRSAGWGLGSHTFLLAGVGRIRGERGNGRRYFAEGGGGLNVGPFGVELSIKFAQNRLSDPRSHWFWTVPMTLRGTLSF